MKLFFGAAMSLLVGNLAGTIARADISCAMVHQQLSKVPGLYERLNYESHKERFHQLFKNLLVANQGLLDGEHESVELRIEADSYVVKGVYLQNESKDSSFDNFKVRFEGAGYNSIAIEVRSNGNVAFLGKSFRFRNKEAITKHYRAVYFDGGFIKSIDQGALILSTLPEKISLSRSLSWTERQRWLNDEPFWSRYGDKVHFAPIYYKFSKEPYQVEMTRQELFEFYRRNELEVNTYDNIGVNRLPKTGPPKMVLTDLGLEFEVVFIGRRAIENLRPSMKRDLKQEILPF